MESDSGQKRSCAMESSFENTYKTPLFPYLIDFFNNLRKMHGLLPVRKGLLFVYSAVFVKTSARKIIPFIAHVAPFVLGLSLALLKLMIAKGFYPA